MNDYMNFNFDYTISVEENFEKLTDYQLIFTKKDEAFNRLFN